MKTVFFQFASSSIHLAASLEIIRLESSQLNQNFYCYWGNATSYPGIMSIVFESLSSKCPKKIRSLVLKADKFASIETRIEFENQWVEEGLSKLMPQIENFSILKELDSLNFSGVKPGPALANEITTITKSRDFNFKHNVKIIEHLLRSYLQVYSSTDKFIMNNAIERVHVFNGRFIHERAVWDSARNAGIETIIFETMRDRFLQRSKGFHDRLNNQLEMINLWELSELQTEEKIEIGSTYFSELRGKSNPFSTTGLTKFELKKPYFVYFSNSDDEAVGFWDEWSENLGSQIDCIKKLQEIFDNQDDFILAIRLHPNLRNKSNKQKIEWLQIQSTLNTKVFGSESEISSYDLLDSCIGSISFGSTLGLESAFNCKPSLLLADSGYDQLKVADKASDWMDVELWIKNAPHFSHEILLKRKENSCIRGYFLAKGGIEFINAKLTKIGWGAWDVETFDGITLKRIWIARYLSKVVSKYKFLKLRKLLNE